MKIRSRHLVYRANLNPSMKVPDAEDVAYGLLFDRDEAWTECLMTAPEIAGRFSVLEGKVWM